MKRLFTFIICILLLLIVKTNTIFAAGFIAPASTQTFGDTTFAHAAANQAQLTGYQTNIKHRLDSLKKDVPLDYNEYVQNYIDIYANNRDEMGQVIGLAKYYFPIYEKVFRAAGIPVEIEYLSVVESKLDPNAVSRVGATGPWQFMSTTARLYGLSMDGYIDERRDPVRASYAAAAYLKDAYEEFGDWLLAIASYNCGKSNVENAIAKAGANDFWSIRQYLPLETRNYVPAYIAVAYLMNYYGKHNIIAQPCSFSRNIDTVLVDRSISLGNISNILNMDYRVLALLNPAYRTQMINGSPANPRRLIIPQCNSKSYSALYDALNSGVISPVLPAHASYVSYAEEKPEHKPAYHKVKRGETLSDIADRYGVDVQDLKNWNHLHHKPAVGQKLKLSGDKEDAAASPKETHNYITYKVKRGDTLSVIAAKFDGASVEHIKSLNGLKHGQLQPGMTLKISKG
ncbi:membrane-bound lytic murein transglycosylase D [Mucilaginibacter mallensis]|uniref:Membrane-bound lytic murein transglycosylase D n=1 Tax=Mucilaginibacter mallensis TaxID=652787 RepID=A0A1H1NQC6_MUCMA|nr:lytic transglycosylase domain-containing protein [Mucilaginibacter mallensis]SDS01216.1 membrane-bound lytic murein transglycosylase D [Mucilaginibacter mallensis]